MQRILIITGTRPEIIKMSPIIQASHNDPEIDLIHADSSQHFDHDMNQDFFNELELPIPDIVLSPERKNEISQISSMMKQVAETTEKIKPDIVLAQGDTNTTMITALTAKRLNIPFGHVEAGIRSFDFNMPEEINRRIADLCASLHFCPTHLSGLNLLFEGIDPTRIFITGNTIVDAVKKIQAGVKRNQILNSPIFSSEFTKNILVTLHRPVNVDNPENIKTIVSSFEMLTDYLFILPIHPRTLKNFKKYNLLTKFERINNIHLLDPLGYLDFLSILSFVDLVITDSGGVQEECLCMKKRCLTIRDNTERPETIKTGANKLINVDQKIIINAINEMIHSREEFKFPELLGSGKSAEIILNIIKDIKKDDLNFISPKMHNWQDYQYQLQEISDKTLLSDIEKKANRRIVLIFDKTGTPHVPKSNFLLDKGYKIVTTGVIY